MVYVQSNALSQEVISQILSLKEVTLAKQQIDLRSTGYITFDIHLTPELKSELENLFGQKFLTTSTGHFSGIQKIPMRWIKGDTLPHIDKTIHSTEFDITYLVYLTNSTGKFLIGSQEYPIEANTAFDFSEAVVHETINTGSEPRLLLGPMNEQGLSVGGGTSISAPGGSTVYIRQTSPVTAPEYDLNPSFTSPISISFPVFITNTNTGLGFLEVKFTTDLTLANSYDYFVCQSQNIQFGSKELKPDGSRPVITVQVNNYEGFLNNGSNAFNGFNNIYVFNLVVDGTGYTSQIGAGWLCQKYFANSSTGVRVVNCSSMGEISGDSGGICGQFTALNSGNVTVIGCSSSGEITSSTSGGIIGSYAGSNSGQITINSCWSSGNITGDGCGGILGAISENVTINDCYSLGQISGNNSGGIIGSNAGNTVPVTVNNCYSRGNISGANSGGICGSLGPGVGETLSVVITNCYSVGNLNNSFGTLCGGISGPLISAGGVFNMTITQCYTVGTILQPSDYIVGNVSSVNGSGSGYLLVNNYSEAGNSGTPGTWNSVNANSVLTGFPVTGVVGATWVSTVTGQPYELLNIGYTPYSTTNIAGSPPDLVRITSSTVNQGSSTSGGFTSLLYSIVQKSGGSPGSYGTITINSTSGVVSTTSGTAPGTYVLYIRNTGSYNFTMFTLTVSSTVIPCLLEDTHVLTPSGYIKIQYLKKGDLVLTSDNRSVSIVNIFQTTVKGTNDTYPCKILKNEIHNMYPPEDLYISQNHLIKYGDTWILPRLLFRKDTSREIIKYYHIKLENYAVDHLVINNGIIVESLGDSKDDHIEYLNRTKLCVSVYQRLINMIQSTRLASEPHRTEVQM